jgi:HD-GYP domain-containing protein (c-di-GMP phosphodiesterase class II)
MSEEAVNELKTAGLLHDIGKIAIDEALLNKPGSLTESEWADIKRHPEIGYHIMKSVNEYAPIAKYVLLHHERIDGKGYPRQLKDEEIPIQAKIISIADAYDAMTNYRTYKKRLSKSEVIEELKKNEGTQFDSKLMTS